MRDAKEEFQRTRDPSPHTPSVPSASGATEMQVQYQNDGDNMDPRFSPSESFGVSDADNMPNISNVTRDENLSETMPCLPSDELRAHLRDIEAERDSLAEDLCVALKHSKRKADEYSMYLAEVGRERDDLRMELHDLRQRCKSQEDEILSTQHREEVARNAYQELCQRNASAAAAAASQQSPSKQPGPDATHEFAALRWRAEEFERRCRAAEEELAVVREKLQVFQRTQTSVAEVACVQHDSEHNREEGAATRDITQSTAPLAKPMSPVQPSGPPPPLPQDMLPVEPPMPLALAPIASPADTEDTRSVCTDQLEDLCREFRLQVREMIVQRGSPSHPDAEPQPTAAGDSVVLTPTQEEAGRGITDGAARSAGEWAAVEAAVADIASAVVAAADDNEDTAT